MELDDDNKKSGKPLGTSVENQTMLPLRQKKRRGPSLVASASNFETYGATTMYNEASKNPF